MTCKLSPAAPRLILFASHAGTGKTTLAKKALPLIIERTGEDFFLLDKDTVYGAYSAHVMELTTHNPNDRDSPFYLENLRDFYTVEVADNLNFFPLTAGMRRSGLTDPTVTMNIEPGTYYWRVLAVDPSGNKSKWALSPYAFQVGLVSLWAIVGVSFILIIIFIFLLRAFIQRIRGYY